MSNENRRIFGEVEIGMGLHRGRRMPIAALVNGLTNRRRLQLGRIRRGRMPIAVRVGSRIARGRDGGEVDVLIWLCERPTAFACSGWPSRRGHLQNRLQGTAAVVAVLLTAKQNSG
jgi:hypothetical protein